MHGFGEEFDDLQEDKWVKQTDKFHLYEQKLSSALILSLHGGQANKSGENISSWDSCGFRTYGTV